MLEITYSAKHQHRQERMHSTQPWFGTNSEYPVDIQNIVNAVRPATILDYGCGCGNAGKKLSLVTGTDVRLYDPFIKEHSQIPAPAELVICWNVLNNVEEEFLSDVVSNLTELATKDLIIKFPVLRHNSRFYLDHFKNLHAKCVTNRLCEITTFNNGMALKSSTSILTAWFTRC
jgi:hypothetical protein